MQLNKFEKQVVMKQRKYSGPFVILFPVALCMTTVMLHAQPALPTIPDSIFGTYYQQRVTHFRSLSQTKSDIIFVGNSITDGAEWSELFHDLRVKNRGISGDISAGVLNRSDEIAQRKPSKVFLMIGINDLARGITPDSIIRNITLALRYIKYYSPASKMFVQSILPVNDAFGKFNSHTNKGKSILQLNDTLLRLADSLHYTFIDLYHSFCDQQGKLNAAFTNDGLHLTGDGYLLWKHLVFPFMYGLSERPALIPQPTQLQWKPGLFFMSTCKGIVVRDTAFLREGLLMHNELAARGMNLPVLQQSPAGGPFIELKPERLTGKEAYRLDVSDSIVSMVASSAEGIFYATQTLLQLLRDDAVVDACSITDSPAFSWRGFMVDVGRNYQSLAQLKQQVDVMARYKLNVFHFHATEDIAWRIAVPDYPQLTAPENMLRNKGMYYTEAELDELIQYCKDRYIRFVPEIDMPGHSAAFSRAMHCNMQSDSGMIILKNILNWFCKRFDFPYLHIGADEVKIANPQFVPQITAFIESLGKKTIGWEPGGNFSSSTIRQLWMDDNGKFTAGKGIQYIDSRHLYLNHMDPLESVVTIFQRRLAGRMAGDSEAIGATLCLWHDRAVASEKDLLTMNPVYPGIVTFAERSWCGGGVEGWRASIGAPGSKEHQAFNEFEKRLMDHQKSYFSKLPFPYAKQSGFNWNLYGPFDNHGNTAMQFSPEKSLQYFQNEKPVLSTVGGTIILRHWWAPTVKGVLEKPATNTTWYAHAQLWSDEDTVRNCWIGFNNFSRSQNTDSPHPSAWDNKGSAIWVNGKKVSPPQWKRAGQKGNSEIPLVDEGYEYRPPSLVNLNKGWNDILVKLPVAGFKGSDWHNPIKWMFTFALPVEE